MLPSEIRAVRRAVLRWAATNDRPLPWRGERDPYRVLVSEVMLQQTQAARVARAYPAFLQRFPTVDDLAAATPADVLRAWGNLGYNRRAMSLWRAACSIAGTGGFPTDIRGLEELPGVGTYTARALASFAFGADAGVVEANVRRLLTRMLGLPPDADVQALADRLVPRGGAARWNQALMDLGAGVCRPRQPRCDMCPMRKRCAWAAGRRHVAIPVPAAPPFSSTMRFVRGRVVSELRACPGGTTARTLARRTSLARRRVAAAVLALERDGLVSRRGETIFLGESRGGGSGEGAPSPDQREMERRRSTLDTK